MKLNPVFKNEIKLSSRTMKSSWMVFGYNAVLIVASMMVLYSMMDTVHYGYSMDYSEMVGLYVVMAYMEFGMILLIIPAITAGSIAGERERQTLDMLLATKMKPWSIVLGKLESSLSSVLMLAVSSLPVLSIVFIFGGVGILELVGFVVILGVSAIFVGSGTDGGHHRGQRHRPSSGQSGGDLLWHGQQPGGRPGSHRSALYPVRAERGGRHPHPLDRRQRGGAAAAVRRAAVSGGEKDQSIKIEGKSWKQHRTV